MIKLFEAFTEDELFPDVFNNQLIRGCKTDKIKFVDDPKNRVYAIRGTVSRRANFFIKSYARLGFQDASQSVHIICKPSNKDIEVAKHKYGGGHLFNVIPKKGSVFTVAIRNTANYPIFTFPENEDYERIHFNYIKDKDEKLFLTEILKYQKEVVDKGFIFNLNYEEMIEWLKQPIDDEIKPILAYYHAWTEYPCLLTRIE